MIKETMYRTQTPMGEVMQARDLRFLQLTMERYMRRQGLERDEWVNWFNPPTVEVQNSYEGRRMVSSTMTEEPFALFGGEARF